MTYQQIAIIVAERIMNDERFDDMLHEYVTDAVTEFDEEEVFDAMMEIASRIVVEAKE